MSPRGATPRDPRMELAGVLSALGAVIARTPHPVRGEVRVWIRHLSDVADRVGGDLRRLDVLALRGLVVELHEHGRALFPEATGADLAHLARLLLPPPPHGRDGDRRALRGELAPPTSSTSSTPPAR